MGKYTRNNPQFTPTARIIDPVWRGIGCVLILVFPLISFACAQLLVNAALAHGWAIPNELLGYIKFPDWLVSNPILAVILVPIAGYNNLKAILVLAIVIFVILYSLYSTLYAVLYKTFGPPRYTATDAPPTGRKTKHYKR